MDGVSAAAWAIALFGITLILLGGGVLFLGKLRDRAGQSQDEPHDLLRTFRELHEQGELSDQEFRTIKTRLTVELQQQLKQAGVREPGMS